MSYRRIFLYASFALNIWMVLIVATMWFLIARGFFQPSVHERPATYLITPLLIAPLVENAMMVGFLELLPQRWLPLTCAIAVCPLAGLVHLHHGWGAIPAAGAFLIFVWYYRAATTAGLRRYVAYGISCLLHAWFNAPAVLAFV